MSKSTQNIQTDYPAEVIDDFVTWLTEHGYSYQEIFESSLETQNYYFQRYLADTGNIQLTIPFE